MTRSNEKGRAFEYILVKTLEESLSSEKIKVIFTERTKKDNIRDKKHFENLEESQKRDFSLASNASLKWMKENNWFINAKEIVIDRLPDREGVNSNVADITLKIGTPEKIEIKEISLKHNHNALKHPRLPRLPDQCGITDESIKQKWVKDHNNIWEDFFKKAGKLCPNATKFSVLKAKDNKFIEQNLYKPLITQVIKFLNENGKNESCVKSFFKFITNKLDFYTIKNEPEQILIKKFVNITAPNSFKIIYPYNNRLTTFLIEFDNGWNVSLRLHTASKEFFRNNKIHSSTKFDVICENLEKVINIDKEKKLIVD